MVFKLGDEEKFRVVRISIETFKRIRKKVREFYDFYESDLFKLPGLRQFFFGYKEVLSVFIRPLLQAEITTVLIRIDIEPLATFSRIIQ